MSPSRFRHQSRPGRSSSWIRPEKRQRIYARDGWRCLWCGRRGVPLTLDHFLARQARGGNDTGNLFTACTACNCKRRHVPALTFAIEQDGTLFDGASQTLERILDALDRPLPTHVP